MKPTIHPEDLIKDIGPNELSGLKVTFINMPLREAAQPNVPPEGPLILSAILRKYGAIPTIVDLNAYRIPDNTKSYGHRHLTYKEAEALLARHLEQRGEQDIIGFSGKITTLRWQEAMAKIVKKLQPDCFLVTGGGLATELKRGLLNWIPELDAVAHSEGDDIILVIARDVKVIREKGLLRANLAGKLSPYYLGEINGKHRFLYAGNRPKNLDAIPFGALDLLENDPNGRNLLEEVYIQNPVWGTAAANSSAAPFTMKRSLTTVSSRGCPYACAFCYRGAQGERNYGMRSSRHLATQVKQLIDRYHIDFIGFPDDNFAISRKRIAELPDIFTEYGVKIRWGTHIRLDEADDRLINMAKAGCIYIGVGAESASAAVLERMKKGGFILKNGMTSAQVNDRLYQFPTTMISGIRSAKEVGVHTNCTWIMGYPGERLEDLKTSVAFILWQQQFMTHGLMPGSDEYKLAYNSVNRRMFTATAYPGTAMFNDPLTRDILHEHFGISFDSVSGEPICDEALHKYVLELDDATKVLNNAAGEPLNFNAMTMDEFLQARYYIDNDQIHKVLEM